MVARCSRSNSFFNRALCLKLLDEMKITLWNYSVSSFLHSFFIDDFFTTFVATQSVKASEQTKVRMAKMTLPRDVVENGSAHRNFCILEICTMFVITQISLFCVFFFCVFPLGIWNIWPSSEVDQYYSRCIYAASYLGEFSVFEWKLLLQQLGLCCIKKYDTKVGMLRTVL